MTNTHAIQISAKPNQSLILDSIEVDPYQQNRCISATFTVMERGLDGELYLTRQTLTPTPPGVESTITSIAPTTDVGGRVPTLIPPMMMPTHFVLDGDCFFLQSLERDGDQNILAAHYFVIDPDGHSTTRTLRGNPTISFDDEVPGVVGRADGDAVAP